jgi:hypothetical protein
VGRRGHHRLRVVRRHRQSLELLVWRMHPFTGGQSTVGFSRLWYFLLFCLHSVTIRILVIFYSNSRLLLLCNTTTTTKNIIRTVAIPIVT